MTLPTPESGEPQPLSFAEELAAAPYLEPEQMAVQWMAGVALNWGEAEEEAQVLLIRQIVDAHGLLRGPDDNLRERDLRLNASRLGKLMSLSPGRPLMTGNREELEASEEYNYGGELVQLVLKDAYHMNDAFDAARAAASREAYLTELSVRDTLTGALNERGVNAVVSRWSRGQQRREDDPADFEAKKRGIISIDVVGMGVMNAVLGEPLVDELLIYFGNQGPQTITREGDAAELARVGGDEFVLMVGNMNELGFDRIVQTIRDRQTALVAEGQQQQMWAELLAAKRASPLDAFGRPTYPFSLQPGPVGPDGEPTPPVLLINGVPTQYNGADLVIISAGGAYGAVGSYQDYDRLLKGAAYPAREADKAELHRLMGVTAKSQVPGQPYGAI
jgi:GGDEF domain-containing protein